MQELSLNQHVHVTSCGERAYNVGGRCAAMLASGGQHDKRRGLSTRSKTEQASG